MLSGRLAQLSLSLAQLSPSLFYLISLVQCLGLKLQCGPHNRATLFYHISLVQCLFFKLQCVQHNSIHFVLSYSSGSMPGFEATMCPAQQSHFVLSYFSGSMLVFFSYSVSSTTVSTLFYLISLVQCLVLKLQCAQHNSSQFVFKL